MSESFERGHCHAIQDRGPFVMGDDFAAPVPADRILWRVNLSPANLRELEECLSPTSSRQKSFADDPLAQDAFWHLHLSNGVADALAWFVSDSKSQPEVHNVRANLSWLEKEISRFEAALPAENDAPGRFVRETYTGECLLQENLKPDEQTTPQLLSAWENNFGFDAVRKRLQVMKDYISAAQSCLGKTKPPEHRKSTLVHRLAHTWQKLTGDWPTSGRDPDTQRQIGPFARFVRTACALLPEQYAPVPLDAAIRKVCEHGRRRT